MNTIIKKTTKNFYTNKLGFTIIEVTLFIAISAFLFAGIAASASINVSRQRYNNSVNDYVEFLKNLYSQVENVENYYEIGYEDSDIRPGCTISSNSNSQSFDTDSNAYFGNGGRSNCAIYGKIAVFNEKQPDQTGNRKEVGVFDIIGEVVDNNHPLPNYISDTLDALSAVNAEYLTCRPEGSNIKLRYAGGASYYTPSWGSRIEVTNSQDYFSGAVMVVRSPADGVIHTYILNLKDAGYRMNNIAAGNTSYANCDAARESAKNNHVLLSKYFKTTNTPHFKTEETDFCVGSDDVFALSGKRRDVRINLDPNAGNFGSNSSVIELVEMDAVGEGGNRCQ